MRIYSIERGKFKGVKTALNKTIANSYNEFFTTKKVAYVPIIDL